MIEVDRKKILELRTRTSCGLMDCKEALISCENDIEKAIQYLREKHPPIGRMIYWTK